MPSDHPSKDRPRREQVRSVFERTEFYFKSDSHIDFRAAAVRELLGDVRAGDIIDVGCGDGRISLQFLSESVRITLLDLSSSMLKLAAARVPSEHAANVSFVNRALEDYVIDRPFDIVLCIGVLAHVSDLGQFVARLAELVAPGGKLIVQITDFDQPVAKVLDWVSNARRKLFDPRGYPTNRTPASAVIELATRAGLQYERSRPHWLPLPGMSVLPIQWRVGFMRFTFERPQISAHGAEKVLLFTRADTRRG